MERELVGVNMKRRRKGRGEDGSQERIEERKRQNEKKRR